MFFREKKTSKHPVLQLVETKRDTAGKVHQRVIISLGGCQVPDQYRKAVAIEVTQRMRGYKRLFAIDDPEVAKWTDLVLQRLEKAEKLPDVTIQEIPVEKGERIESVCVDDIEHENGTELGPVLVLLQAWKALGLDEFLAERKFSTNQIATAKVSILNRLLDPCSENDLVNWVTTTALDDLLNIQTGAWGEDRFYRISDKLLTVQKRLEEHLRERERSLFNLDRTILLYDLTNSYFEGAAENNNLAERTANSKEKRSDCPVISVGVVLDAKGFILTHKIFQGNTHDCKTLLDAVKDLEKNTARGSRPVVVLDGGIATESNLQALKSKGYDYVVNGKRQKRSEFAEDFCDQTKFTCVEGRAENKSRRPVFVRRLQTEDETVVLCRSDGRRDKEDAIQDNAQRKLIEGLEMLEARILRHDAKLKLDKGGALVNRAIGRLTSRTTRAAKLYDIDYEHKTRTLSWECRQEAWDKNRELHGCYHLRSSLNMPDQDLWKLYITLTRVETAFRYMKSDLGLRPFHHQTAQRCKAHIWITVLAYHLLRYIEFSLELSGYNASWKTIRRRLKTHCYATIIVPASDKREHQIRKPGRPNVVQSLIYDLLNVNWKACPILRKTCRIQRTRAKV